MANRRLLENGVDRRLLENGVDHRLVEDGPSVAGGQIAFPGGYGFGSGGYAGGGAGAGGGGLSGGGQGGAGSGGGGGTGTTTTVQLPFKPGLVMFICTNQTLGGWRTYLDGSFHWTCTGIAAWGAADKSSIFNCAHITHHNAEPWPDSFLVGGHPHHGAGQDEAHCIWIQESATGPKTALAHVTGFHAGGFDLEWDNVAGAGYPIYFVAARDQKSWGHHERGAPATSPGVVIDGLVGGQQDNRPQGGFSFHYGADFVGDGGGQGETRDDYLTSSVGTWARPDQGSHFTPPGGREAAMNNVFEQASYIDFDSDAGIFVDLPGNLAAIVMSPWIAGSILQGWQSLYLSNGQARFDFDANNPQGFGWATGALNSCDSRFIDPATSGEEIHPLEYGFADDSTFKPQMGFTYMRPSQDGGTAIGHSVGLWARTVENDPTKDFHAVIATGRHNASGLTVGYHGVGASWMGEFSLAVPGDTAMGRLRYDNPGEIVTITDQSSSEVRQFMLWMNGVTVGGWLPQMSRHKL